MKTHDTRVFLAIERERGRKRKRERKIDVANAAESPISFSLVVPSSIPAISSEISALGRACHCPRKNYTLG